MLERCTGTNRDGKPCSAQAWRGGLCRWHHPDLAGERAAWRAKGGERRSNASRARKALPKHLQGLLDTLYDAAEGVHNGEYDPKRATALAGLARAIVLVNEHGDLAQRLAALEERLGTG